MMIKYVKIVKLHTKYATVFLNTQTLRRFRKIQMFML